MTERFFERDNIGKRPVRSDIGIGGHKARLITLYPAHHFRLFFDGLRTVNERNSALFGKRDGHAVVGNRLHDRGYKRYVHGNCRFLAALEFDKRRFQRNIQWNAVGIRISGNEQILAESMRRLAVIIRHFLTPFIFSMIFAIIPQYKCFFKIF